MAPAAASQRAASRIVAIGDLHGDHGAWRDIARDAGLIDDRGRWAGGTSILVQVGDVPDRGPDTLMIIHDLMRLQREAPRSGGRVVAMVGNHEAMNMTGDLRYVSAGEYAAFVDKHSQRRRTQVFEANRDSIEAAALKEAPLLSPRAIEEAWIAKTPLGFVEHQRAWHPRGEIGRWVVANPAVLLLEGTLFVHGGLSSAYAGRSIDDINRAVAAALTARETQENSVINDPLGPLWYRGFACKGGSPAPDQETGPVPASSAPPVSAGDELAQVLRAFGAERMVIGHTPILAGISVLNGGRLVCIDTGISAAYDGRLGWLEIIDGKLKPHLAQRSTQGGGEAK